MKVKIKKDFEGGKGKIKKGATLNVSSYAARKWIKDGLAQAVR